jgi:hypothetical protein
MALENKKTLIRQSAAILIFDKIKSQYNYYCKIVIEKLESILK